MTSPAAPFVAGLSRIADRYPAVICDVWGVLHNGEVASPGTAEALRAYRRQGGRVALLTNAPRPAIKVCDQLIEIYGYDEDCWDTVVTSGDATTELLKARGRFNLHHIGPDRDLGLYEGTGAHLTAPGKADIVVVTGLFDDETETPETYREALTEIAERSLPMICANPDLVVERGGKLVHCAGGLAKLYRELGGAVTYLGKPYRPVYDVARARLSALVGRPVAGKDILAIGDGLPTDVTGARDEGLALLFITAGIHAADFGPSDAPDPDKVAARLASIGAVADAVMPHLVW